MWMGASVLSLYFLPLSTALLSEFFKSPHPYFIPLELGVISLLLVSSLLLIWCNGALIVDAWKRRRVPKMPDHWPPSVGECVVGIAAFCFGVYLVPRGVQGLVPYRLYGRLDILITAVMFSLFGILLDVAVVVKAVKMWRANRTFVVN
jgi:hypothetical protein